MDTVRPDRFAVPNLYTDFVVGVYFAKDGTVSFGSYSAGASACWRNSAIRINSCAALAEIVNLPRSFVSTNPFFVVDKTDWIIW